MPAEGGGDWRAIREWVQQQDEEQRQTLGLLEGGNPEAFWGHVALRTIPRGKQIFSASQPAGQVYLVVRGRARVYGVSPDGRVVTFWYIRPGQFFGLAEALGSVNRKVYADATENLTVLEIKREYFHDLLRERIELVTVVLDQLATRLRRSCDATLALATASVRSRLAHLLLLLFAGEHAEPTTGSVLPERYSQQELAEMIGASRQATNEALVDLRRSRAIGVRDGRLVLLDSSALLSYETADD